MITTAHVYTTLFIHLGVILVVTAYYTVGAAMLPSLTRGSAERMAQRPLRVALVGLAISAPWMAAAIALMALGGPLGLAGVIMALLWVLVGLVGGAGIAEHVGRFGGDATGWRCVARGGFFVALTWVMPLIGWFVVLPATLAAGIGCVALNRSKAAAPPAPIAA
ncbi:MAG: hypothetical protein U0575_08205 [Phycisphaerales bacterium]